MKKTLLSLFAILLHTQVPARNHNDHIPAESLFVLQLHNSPEQRERIRATPLGEVWDSIDWPALANAAAVMFAASAEGDDMPSSDEILRKFTLFSQRLNLLSHHFTGDISLVVGDLAPFVKTLIENQERRTAFFQDINLDEENGADIEKALEEEAALDAIENQAIAKAFFLMADVQEGDKLLELLADWTREILQDESAANLKHTQTEWQGVTLHMLRETADEDDDPITAGIDTETGLSWTVFDGVLLVAFSESGLQESLERLQNRPANRLSASLEFQAATAFLGDVDSHFYFNLPVIDRLIRLAIPADAPGFGTLTPDALLRELGLDSFTSLSIGSRTTAAGIENRTRFGFQRESMLSRLFMTPVEELKPAETPPFIHQGISQLVSLRWSLARFYDALEKELATLSPEAAMALGFGRMAAGQQLGFDLKTGLLDHVDAGLIVAQQNDWEVMTRLMEAAANTEDPSAAMEVSMANPTGGTYYLIGLQLKNPQAVQSAVNSLLALVFSDGLPKPEMYLAQPVFFPAAAMPQTPSAMRKLFGYTFLDDYLLLSVGDPRMLHRAIDASQNPDQRLWTQPGYITHRAKLPPLAHALDYSSSEAMREAYTFLIALLEKSAKEAGVTVPDLSAFTRLFGDSVGITQRNGLLLEQQGLIPFAETR